MTQSAMNTVAVVVAYLIGMFVVALPAYARDDIQSTDDLVSRMGSSAAAYDATVCKMTAYGEESLYVLVVEKYPGAAGADDYPASVWKLDRDGSHGYVGCDGGISDTGHLQIGQWTSGLSMHPVCVCAFERMRRDFKSEPLEKTTGARLVLRAERQDCGTIDTELFRTEGRCSEGEQPIPD